MDKTTKKIVNYSSATFNLYKLNEKTDKWEQIKCKVGNKYYDSWTTNKEGIAITETKLKAGKYKVDEIITPKGYLPLEDELTFELNNDMENIEYDEDYDAYATVVAEDEQPTGTLILNKKLMIKNDTDTLINGTTDLSKIKFKLIAKDNILDMADGSIIYSAKQEVGTYNLDKEGNLKVENLPMGNYQLQEISTLEGFVLDEKLYDITFDMKNVVNKVCEVKKELTNDMTVVEFSKTDIAGQKELKGAKLSVLDENGKVIDKWTSTDKTHTIQGLAVRKNFILREEIAPRPFVKATEVKFTVENKKIQKVTMIDKIVEITKTDLTTGDELEGAELEVIDKETKKTVDKWVSTEEPHKVKNLEENKTYVLKEKTCPYRI